MMYIWISIIAILVVIIILLLVWILNVLIEQDEINKKFLAYVEQQKLLWKTQIEKWAVNDGLWKKYNFIEMKKIQDNLED